MAKRIALLTDNADPLVPLGGYEAGGENVYVYELARSIGRLGWIVDVFTRWSSPKTSQIARMGENVRVIRLPAGPLEFVPKEQLFPYMPAYIDSFMAFKQTHKLDYLLLHGNYYLSAWAAVQIGQKLGIPAVSTFHTLGIVKHRALNSFDPSPDDRIEKEKEVMQGEDRIIATSPVMKDEIVTMYGMPAKKIVVIPGGVNLKRFTPLPQHIARRVLSINPNKIIILYVGRMERRKGIDTLIEAMSFLVQRMPEKRKVMRLLISGGEARKGIGKEGIPEKTEKERLKKLVDHLGLKDVVRFTGNIDRENLPFYYASADVTVVPSYYEPFGLVPLESMACGTPVVASKTGGLMYTIKDGKTGSLVSPKDPAGFADKIYELLDNATTRKYFRENGIDRVTRMFSWESVGHQMSDFYHDTIIEYYYRHVQRMRALGLR